MAAYRSAEETHTCKSAARDQAADDKKEKEVKARNEELEGLRARLEHEQSDNQNSKKQAEELQASVGELQLKVQQVNESCQKLRQEIKRKTEQIEKLERTNSHLEDRMRNLEIRASEVEKAELTLESTRRNLENSQQECRARDGEIRRLTDKYDRSCQDLAQSKKKISELEQRIEDLKLQVRHALIKNENIEKGLEMIPQLKDDIEERNKEIGELKKALEEQTLQLATSRKAVREFRDRARELEGSEAEGEHLRTELQLARHEVTSLKRLVTGKDALLMRKGQALDQAKEIIEELSRTSDKNEAMKKVTEIISRMASLSETEPDGDGSQSANHQHGVTTPTSWSTQGGGREAGADPEPHGGWHNGDTEISERWPLGDSTSKKTEGRANRTAVVHPVRRSASVNDHPRLVARCRPAKPNGHQGVAIPYRPETRVGTRYQPWLDYPLGGAEDGDSQWVRAHSSLAPRKSGGRPYSALVGAQCVTNDGSDVDSCSSLDTEYEGKLLARAQLTARQKDDILAAAVAVGDRVIFTITQKPPRYGRKKPQAVVYTGMVKYIGQLDSETHDTATYVGLRLDDAIGENDGTFKGRRYMFTPHNHAKFFRVRDLTSVLDVKSGQYIPASRLLLRHLKKNPGSD
ncbi:lamin-A-like isoform X2 [Pomacea canaliculata]|uniref:lamin-A-like isoform X2 n=1 Tax=Pomacea canaliculata TaxID=400727 RepID=UPI000D731919|nr:lamin-A-like isoform X2 [Pomacea canaliculata]